MKIDSFKGIEMGRHTMTTPFTLDMAAIMARQATINLGTLGNVSEGKSTFVRALSGTATQKHQKEKRLNITIHLGYAGFKIWRHLETGDILSSPSQLMEKEGHELICHYSFVDCPGHEAYLATMLSGAAIMDAAALMIAANSPNIPQIQTQEHLMAAELMSLPHVFTVQNKLDVVPNPKESLEKIQVFIKDTIAEAGPIIPMSAQLGWGLENAIHHLAYNMPQPVREYDGALRMMLVRSFDINKPSVWIPGESVVQGGVVGGTILRGVLQKDDIVEVRPGIWNGAESIPLLTRVKSLYCDTTELPYAVAGGLVGLGTTLDPRFTAANTLAGQVIGTPGTLPDITVRIKGKFKSFSRDSNNFKKHVEGEAISFCVGIMTVKGKISEVDKHSRTIKLERPVCVEPGQICGILRSNGSRELLDGVLIVKSAKPFKDVRAWSPEQLEIVEKAKEEVLQRKYVVKEFDVRKDACPLPSYEHMLDAIESLHTTESKDTVRFPGPVTSRLPKHTLLVNAPAIVKALTSDLVIPTEVGSLIDVSGHFEKFIADELSTSLTVKSEGGYMIKGRFTEANMRSMLRKYMTNYHTCKQCASFETRLYKADRIIKLYCGKCTSSSAVTQL